MAQRRLFRNQPLIHRDLIEPRAIRLGGPNLGQLAVAEQSSAQQNFSRFHCEFRYWRGVVGGGTARTVLYPG